MGQWCRRGVGAAGRHVGRAGPEGYPPRDDIVADAERSAAQTGGGGTVRSDPADAVAGADAVITDTWVSMGQESEKAARVETFGDYRVTPELMDRADDDAIFLHCLPAYREFEVAPEVIDGPQSAVWDEAENRVHAQKGLMVWLLSRA